MASQLPKIMSSRHRSYHKIDKSSSLLGEGPGHLFIASIQSAWDTVPCWTFRLVVSSVGRVAVAIAICATCSRCSSGSGSGIVLVATEATEPGFFSLGLTAKFDVIGGGVSGESVVTGHIRAVLVAAPEPFAAARGISVGRRGAEALLALMVACQQDLEEHGDQEEEAVGEIY